MTKRYDPGMHTAEHILNQTMVRTFQCDRSFSAHIEKKKSKCDYRFERDLTPDEVADIEKTVNEVIRRNLPVKETFLSRAEAERQFNLGRLPDMAGDDIRIITVGDYDACPCIGLHATGTDEIGQFRITSTSYNDGTLRIRFKVDKNEAG